MKKPVFIPMEPRSFNRIEKMVIDYKKDLEIRSDKLHLAKDLLDKKIKQLID